MFEAHARVVRGAAALGVAILLAGCVLDWDPAHRSAGSSGAGSGGGFTPSSIECDQCPGDGPCSVDCPSGDCKIACGSAVTCAVSCPGGSCIVSCDDAQTCAVECGGGGCVVGCDSAATCSLDCGGGGCICDRCSG
jgi:hypothetical protein